MRVRVRLHGFDKPEASLELAEAATADDAPRALGIRPELVIVFRDGRPIPGDEPLQEGDELRLLRVVSGGGPPPPGRLRRCAAGDPRCSGRE